MRASAIARTVYGSFLVLTPGVVVRTVSGKPADRAPAVVARILGLRHLAQALAIDRAGTRDRLLVGAAIDAAHALSMFGLAALNEGYRRPAALDAVLATGLAANGLREARDA